MPPTIVWQRSDLPSAAHAAAALSIASIAHASRKDMLLLGSLTVVNS